ncbi:MAG: PorP/SprF family type IX secretion system membrane protein [Flavobacteriales bacterium]|nr:PorP/SprF family type IX secretion system membrane protein [Flavobacteriales bacterium]
MMTKSILKVLLIASTTVASSTCMLAQDFHLSQFDMLPLYFNPAQTGMYFGEENMNYRFSGNYRSQWQKLQGKPYSAVGVGYDMPLKRFGVGLLMMDHIAGVSNFETYQFLLSGAYRVTSDESKNHFLTAGLQLGFFQKRFSYGDLLFENQYTTSDGLDANLPNGENLPDMSIVRFDANVGIYYKYIDSRQRFAPSVGFSIYHVNTPDESFTGNRSNLPMRFNGIFDCPIKLNDKVELIPNLLLMYQQKAVELNAGVLAGYSISQSEYSLLGGFGIRRQDAVVIHLGMKQGNNTFRVSYDVVTSALKNAGGGRGGFEMAVIYSGWHKKKSKPVEVMEEEVEEKEEPTEE